MTDEPHHALAAPCKSCPYRCDVPSGVWSPEEYAKLPKYDGSIMEQALQGAHGLFLCHQKNNALCSGWLACHGPTELFAMRMFNHHVEPEAFDYTTDVPVFSSGAEAAAHGMRDIDEPGDKANRVVATLLKNGKGRARDD